MEPDRAKVDSIFAAALEHPVGEERSAYLDQACGDDVELRRRVEHLLRAQSRMGDFLEAPAPEIGVTIDYAMTEGPGMTIGPYKLLEQIGEGGMGVVYLADQREPVKRRVALKIIKPGMDTQQVIVRFEAERQALAMMDHPHIAQVYDAGTTETGRPYFVMELVKGTPITMYCDEKRFGVRERLKLFVEVCQAVQHAHQKGIIHRDLKPSNILVAPYDGLPVVKVIDFGVAKATGPVLTEKTLFTGFGAVVGTLEYMSPEQAEVNNQDIDTRSDIFGLGVLLYELLTGTTPLEPKRVQETGLLEALRIIREEEAPTLSHRLSSTKELPAIAANRDTEPEKLTKLLRGELNWIVMKALAKERSQRYETANGLAQDIQRYLADEPVEACPPSMWYRFRKFARRRKSALVIAALALCLVAVLAGGIGWVVGERNARQRAAAARIEEALREVEEVFQGKDWRRAEVVVTRAEGLAAGGEGGEEFQARLEELRRDLDMLTRLREVRLSLSRVEDEGFDTAGMNAEYAAAFREFNIDVDKLDPAGAARRIQARAIPVELATALDDWAMGRKRFRGAAVGDWKRLLTIARLADPDPWRSQVRLALENEDAEALTELAETVPLKELSPVSLGLLAVAVRDQADDVDRAVELLREGRRLHPDDFWINHDLAHTLIRKTPPDWDGAVRFYTAAVALRPRSPGANLNLGAALYESGMINAALAAYERALEFKPDYAMARCGRASALIRFGRFDEALDECSDVLVLGQDFAPALRARGAAYYMKGEPEKALADCSKAIELEPESARGYYNRAGAYYALRRYKEALADYTRAIEWDENDEQFWYNRSGAYLQLGRLDDAIEDLTRAVELNPAFARGWIRRGAAYYMKSEYQKAVDDFTEAVHADRRNFRAWSNRGETYFKLGRYELAVADCTEAIKLNPKYQNAWFNRANAHLASGEYEKAVADYTEALDLVPGDADCLLGRGSARAQLGQWAKAIADYSQVLEVAPPAAHGPALNQLARIAATCPEPEFRDPKRAVEHAQKAVDLQNKEGGFWNTLGVSQYRAEDWDEAVTALEKSMELNDGGSAADWLFLAMARWQKSEKDEARMWHRKAVEWMEEHKPDDEELRRFRAEADELLTENK